PRQPFQSGRADARIQGGLWLLSRWGRRFRTCLVSTWEDCPKISQMLVLCLRNLRNLQIEFILPYLPACPATSIASHTTGTSPLTPRRFASHCSALPLNSVRERWLQSIGRSRAFRVPSCRAWSLPACQYEG